MENKVMDKSQVERIEREALEKYPYVDIMPRETGYHENDVAEKQQEAYIAGATAEAQRNKEDAIGFAEWLRDNHWQFFFTERVWFNMVDNTENPRTTEQLYNEYINQKV